MEETMQNDDRPIKVHCDKQMRDHIEFVLNRYKGDAEFELNKLKDTRPHAKDSLRKQIALTQVCIDELKQAGT